MAISYACSCAVQKISLDIQLKCSYLRDYVERYAMPKAFTLVCFRRFFLQPRKFKCVHVITSCLDGHPGKFIYEKL